MKNDFPRNWTNPTEEYLKMEKANKGQKICWKIIMGYRLTREEFTKAVEAGAILREDTDHDFAIFMNRWQETEDQFEYFYEDPEPNMLDTFHDKDVKQ